MSAKFPRGVGSRTFFSSKSISGIHENVIVDLSVKTVVAAKGSNVAFIV